MATLLSAMVPSKGTYNDGDAPFSNGTVRQAKATRKDHASEISYQPNFPEEGKYAVYVSYQTVSKSVPDARYVVYHKGQATEFTVNQRMGGGTWVYLGTFEFDKGCSRSTNAWEGVLGCTWVLSSLTKVAMLSIGWS